ncbi:MAG: flavin reductase family protein [Oscillospiraceae bacterium]
MDKTTWKGSALLAPVPPVLVSCGTMEKPNALTIAWTGIINTIPPKTYISVRPERYSYDLIRESGEFVINLTTAAIIRAVDYCGCKSGRDEDKLAMAKLTVQPSSAIDCPMIAESPVSIECRVCDIIPLGSHDMFLAEIVAVNVATELIGEDGRLRLAKAGLAAYAHGEYFALGKKIGDFGFSVKKRKKKPQFDRSTRQQK